METRSHQEWRARRSLNATAVWQVALSVGAIFFIMSGGGPWTTAGTMNAAMGRDLPWGFLPLLFLHFTLAYAYALLIGLAVYRLRLGAAIVTGPAIGLALFGINHFIFSNLGIVMQSPEFRTILVHLFFGLFAVVAYKGASVRPPFEGDDREVALATDRSIGSLRRSTDPEPLPQSDQPVRRPAQDSTSAVPSHAGISKES